MGDLEALLLLLLDGPAPPDPPSLGKQLGGEKDRDLKKQPIFQELKNGTIIKEPKLLLLSGSEELNSLISMIRINI